MLKTQKINVSTFGLDDLFRTVPPIVASRVFICNMWIQKQRWRQTLKMCTDGGKEPLSSLRGSFKPSASAFICPLPALPVRSVVKHTHAEPHLQAREREPRRQDRSMLKSQL